MPINTQDFDLVHDRAKDNVARLLLALAELGAVYADDPRHLKPNESHLVGPGNQLLRCVFRSDPISVPATFDR